MHEERQFAIGNPLSWIVFPIAGYMWYELGVLVVTGSPSPPSPGNQPIPVWGLMGLFLLAGVIVPLVVCLMHLRVRVGGGAIDARFWPFLRKRVPLEAVRAAEAIEYRPLAECLGWGIRSYRGGPALTVWGNRGVLVRHTDEAGRERRLLLGSQNPEALAEAIRAGGGGRGAD